MISHVFVGVGDFSRAMDFYSAVLAELGLQQKFCEAEKSWAGWMTPGVPRPLFLVGHPCDGKPATTGNGQMTALFAPTRAALAHGGTNECKPGLRPRYLANYYGAYFRDPDGNKLCVCCHVAPEAGRA